MNDIVGGRHTQSVQNTRLYHEGYQKSGQIMVELDREKCIVSDHNVNQRNFYQAKLTDSVLTKKNKQKSKVCYVKEHHSYHEYDFERKTSIKLNKTSLDQYTQENLMHFGNGRFLLELSYTQKCNVYDILHKQWNKATS